MGNILTYLDPFQWTLLLGAAIAFFMCGKSFLKTNADDRLTMGLFTFFNFYVILKYLLFIYFRLDSLVLSNNEEAIIQFLTKILQLYVVLITLYASGVLLLENRKSKKMGR